MAAEVPNNNKRPRPGEGADLIQQLMKLEPKYLIDDAGDEVTTQLFVIAQKAQKCIDEREAAVAKLLLDAKRKTEKDAHDARMKERQALIDSKTCSECQKPSDVFHSCFCFKEDPESTELLCKQCVKLHYIGKCAGCSTYSCDECEDGDFCLGCKKRFCGDCQEAPNSAYKYWKTCKACGSYCKKCAKTHQTRCSACKKTSCTHCTKFENCEGSCKQPVCRNCAYRNQHKYGTAEHRCGMYHCIYNGTNPRWDPYERNGGDPKEHFRNAHQTK